MDCNEVLLLRGNWQTENWIAWRMHFIFGAYVRRVRGIRGVGGTSPYQNDGSILCLFSFVSLWIFIGSEPNRPRLPHRRVSSRSPSPPVSPTSSVPALPTPFPHHCHHTVEISSVKCFVSPHRACGEMQRSSLVSALLRLTFSQKPSTLEGRL